MLMPDDLILWLCGLHSLCLALFHIAFWKLFRWPDTLRQTTRPNRAILQIANVQLIWLFLGVAVLCWAYPSQLRETPLGRAILLGMAGFWAVRLIQQFIFLRIHHPLVHILSIVFALGAIAFALPLME